MFEGGILSPRCRSGSCAARPSGRRPLRRLAALGRPADAGRGPAGRRGPGPYRRRRAAPTRKKTDGWIQLTHLSPNTPPVDVYLYSFGDAKAMLVLKHVAYGTVSPV